MHQAKQTKKPRVKSSTSKKAQMSEPTSTLTSPPKKKVCFFLFVFVVELFQEFRSFFN